MATLAELTNLKAMALYYEQKLLTQPAYLGETYMPAIKIATDALAYMTQKQSAPKLARGSMYDAQPTPRNREQFEKELFRTSFFRDTSVLNEADIEEINRALFTHDDALFKSLLTGLFDDKTNMLLGMRARREFMAMQAVMGGKLEFVTNGVSTTVEYASDEDLQKDVSTDWTDLKNSNPIEDLRDAITAMKHKGITPNQVLMNDDTFRLIQRNEKVKATFWPQNANFGAMFMTENNVVDALISELHVIPVVYDKGFEDKEATGTDDFTPFVTGEKVVLLNAPIPTEFAKTGTVSSNLVTGAQALGHMAFAPTPEELGVRNGKIAANTVQFFDTGVAYHEYFNDQLVQTQDLVSMNVLPSFEGSQSVFRLTIKQPAASTGTEESGSAGN